MFKKLALKGLCVALCAGSLAGCSTGSTPTTTTPQTESKPKAEESAQKKEDVASQLVVYNNSGSIAGPGSESGADPKIMAQVKEWFKEGTGHEVDVVVPPAGEEEKKLNLLLAANEQIDVFWGKWPEYASKKMIIPLNEYLDTVGQDIKAAWPQESWDCMTDKDGNIWGIPRMTPFLGNPIWIREDWLEAVGLPMPKTIDEYEQVLKAFKEQKPGGEGTIPLLADIAGKHSSKGLHNTFLGAFTEYGYSNWYDETDGKVKPAELQPGFKDFLTTMNRWYTEGYMFPEFAALSKDKIREIIKQGRAGSAAVWYSNITLSAYDLQKNIPTATYAFPLGGLEGPKGKAETAQGADTQGAMISANCNDPKAAIEMLNFIYANPENHMVSWYGPEDMFWKWEDKDQYVYETIGEKQGYYAEYAFAIGLPMETAVVGNNPQQAIHQDYLKNDGTDLVRAKMPVDAGIVYDPAIIKEKVPGASDIQRMIDEETIKFVMGKRPIDEFDQFVDQLYQAGLDKWIECYTQMYLDQKK
ncbi:extracellular solute-binding protein [Niameybacter massiliensis]|uniref:extracellular solute-binding protein n=1 Tax=Niameybacter massiliensis TaxID=1658108 RepID=UPI0006B527D9|nr:extracellular solute-binding protein [Niameybacter massiliensis]